MAIAGAAIGAAGSLIGSIFNAVSSSRAAREARKIKLQYLRNMMKDENSWYNRRIDESALDKVDNQYAATKFAEQIRDRHKAAQGNAAVMGGTDESVAAVYNADSQAQADLYAQQASDAVKEKDAIEDSHKAAINSINGSIADVNADYQQTRAQNISTAVSGAVDAAKQVAGAIDTGETKAPSTTKAITTGKYTTGDLKKGVTGEHDLYNAYREKIGMRNATGGHDLFNAYRERMGLNTGVKDSTIKLGGVS